MEFGESSIQIRHVKLEISANEVTTFVTQSELGASRACVTSLH